MEAVVMPRAIVLFTLHSRYTNKREEIARYILIAAALPYRSTVPIFCVHVYNGSRVIKYAFRYHCMVRIFEHVAKCLCASICCVDFSVSTLSISLWDFIAIVCSQFQPSTLPFIAIYCFLNRIFMDYYSTKKRLFEFEDLLPNNTTSPFELQRLIAASTLNWRKGLIVYEIAKFLGIHRNYIYLFYFLCLPIHHECSSKN